MRDSTRAAHAARLLLCTGFSALLLTAPARSQVAALEVVGHPLLGSALASPGDVDGDGVDDVASTGTDTGGLYVRVFSGLNGSLLQETTGIVFGLQAERVDLSAAGDVNADGVGDLVLGMGSGQLVPGRAIVISGTDGSVIHDLPLPTTVFSTPLYVVPYPIAVTGVGDLDQDGFDDFCVGEPAHVPPRVRVFSGLNAVPIRTWTSGVITTAMITEGFGEHVGPAGDFDGDGTPDVAVGLPSRAPSGAFFVFSGATSLQLFGSGQSASLRLGASSTPLGDWNGDGSDDLAVTSFDAGIGTTAPGSQLWIIGGGGAGVLATGAVGIGDTMGRSVAVVADLDADGVRDFVLTNPHIPYVMPGQPSQLVFDASLVSGAQLQVIGTLGGHSGFSLFLRGDVIALGAAGPHDFVLGDPLTPAGGSLLFYASTLSAASLSSLGTGYAPAGPPPLLGATSPLLGSSQGFFVFQAPALSPGGLILAPGPSVPTAPTTSLVIWPDLQRSAEWLVIPLLSDAAGSAVAALPLPPLAGLEGFEAVAQAWFPSPTGLLASSFTNGLQMVLGY